MSEERKMTASIRGLDGKYLLVKQPECRHTFAPKDYLDWHAWVAEKSKTHRQERCHFCGLWAMWVPK